MKLTIWPAAAAGALALGLSASAVEAAPAGGLAAQLDSQAAQTSDVHEAAWHRRCWWHRGHRHCRRYWSEDYGYYYDSNLYYGYGPGIGFFFGGRGHHHHGHRHHHGGRHFHGGRGHGRGRH